MSDRRGGDGLGQRRRLLRRVGQADAAFEHAGESLLGEFIIGEQLDQGGGVDQPSTADPCWSEVAAAQRVASGAIVSAQQPAGLVLG